MVINNIVNGPNLASFEFKNEECGYLAGVLAGLMTKTNKVGAVGGWEIPSIVRAINAFEDGAKSVNPDVEVFTAYTGSWDDIAKGKEDGLALISRGADVVWEFADAAGLGVIEAAKEKGVLAIGGVADKSSVAPDTVIASAIEEIPPLIEAAVQYVVEGTFEGKNYWFGVAEGPIRIINFSDKVPEDVKQKVLQVQQDIAEGKIVVERKDTR